MRRLAVLWSGCALAVAASLAAPPAVHLTFLEPRPGQPLVGDITVEVEVLGEGVEGLRLLVDGRPAGRRSKPPYRFELSLGDDLGSHRLEAVARGGGVELARAVRVTPAIVVDERVDLGLQQLYVTVRGPRADDLAAADFRVVDDGRRQDLVTFERGDAALTAALLVDASDSMRGGRLAAALDGARAFVASMRRLDEAAVLLVSDAVVLETAFLETPGELESALAGAEVGGGTALNDALYLALRRLESRQGRRVVVLLSDGVDVHSVLGAEDVLWTLRRSRSVVYWIALGDTGVEQRYLSPWRSTEEHRRELDGLRDLVHESGGRIVTIGGAGEAAAAFEEILAELRSQFVLGYYPTVDRGDGRWHEVEVQVTRPGHRARTRGGYVDF